VFHHKNGEFSGQLRTLPMPQQVARSRSRSSAEVPLVAGVGSKKSERPPLVETIGQVDACRCQGQNGFVRKGMRAKQITAERLGQHMRTTGRKEQCRSSRDHHCGHERTGVEHRCDQGRT